MSNQNDIDSKPATRAEEERDLLADEVRHLNAKITALCAEREQDKEELKQVRSRLVMMKAMLSQPKCL